MEGFASRGDLTERTVAFVELAPGAFARTAEGDPNAGVVVGDDGVMAIDAAPPAAARDLIGRIRAVTDRPITHLVLTHHHAIRVAGAPILGARRIVASQAARDLLAERGREDFESQAHRFPRLFQGAGPIPGPIRPDAVFERALTVRLGERRVDLLHLGRGHTAGDIVAWLPDDRVLFAGDLVEYGVTPYCGDAYLAEWPATLDALRALAPEKLVPGRGDALTTPDEVEAGIEGTRDYVAALYEAVRNGVAAGKPPKAVYDAVYAQLRPRYGHWLLFERRMPFNVTRAYDEASGVRDPRPWTKARDLATWAALHGES